ncbi:MAG: hypothetical protein GY931_19700 [Maribacter sp.]|nr:hypothetical protein [Maribacter sp.]
MENEDLEQGIDWETEYYKLKSIISLWDYYEKLARTEVIPLPKYPEIAMGAMKEMEKVDPHNKSKARPGVDFENN